jgi:hypothetical protein
MYLSKHLIACPLPIGHIGRTNYSLYTFSMLGWTLWLCRWSHWLWCSMLRLFLSGLYNSRLGSIRLYCSRLYDV